MLRPRNNAATIAARGYQEKVEPWSRNAVYCVEKPPHPSGVSFRASSYWPSPLLAYIPVMRGGFIWDDNVSVTNSAVVRDPGGLRRFWFTTESPDYFPLTSTLSGWSGGSRGDHAAGYHVVNVLLHAVSAVLVWRVLRRLSVPGAWLAGFSLPSTGRRLLGGMDHGGEEHAVARALSAVHPGLLGL